MRYNSQEEAAPAGAGATGGWCLGASFQSVQPLLEAAPEQVAPGFASALAAGAAPTRLTMRIVQAPAALCGPVRTDRRVGPPFCVRVEADYCQQLDFLFTVKAYVVDGEAAASIHECVGERRPLGSCARRSSAAARQQGPLREPAASRARPRAGLAAVRVTPARGACAHTSLPRAPMRRPAPVSRAPLAPMLRPMQVGAPRVPGAGAAKGAHHRIQRRRLHHTPLPGAWRRDSDRRPQAGR